MTTPSQSMVAKLARTLCNDLEARRFADQEDADSYDCSTEYVQRYWQQLARAALTAMLNPSFDAKMAGAQAITAEMMAANANYDAAIACWNAIVRHMLNEGEG